MLTSSPGWSFSYRIKVALEERITVPASGSHSRRLGIWYRRRTRPTVRAGTPSAGLSQSWPRGCFFRAATTCPRGRDPRRSRVQANGLTAHCIEYLAEQLEPGGRASAMIGFQSGRLQFTDLTSYPQLIEEKAQRAREQRWMSQLPLAEIMTL